MKEYCSFLGVLLNHIPAIRPPFSPAAASKQGGATQLKGSLPLMDVHGYL